MPHPNIQQSPHMPGHPGMHPGHQFPGGGQFPGQHPGNMMGHPGANMPGMYPGHMNESMAARINQQRMYGGMMPGMHPMQQPQPATQPTKKHQVLPKEVCWGRGQRWGGKCNGEIIWEISLIIHVVHFV